MQDYRNLPSEEKQAFWHNHISAWQKSASTRKEYCKTHNLKLSTFGYWQGRLKGQKNIEKELVPLSFPPPKVPGSSRPALELVLGDALYLKIPEGFDRQHLARVLDVLGIRL